MPSYYKSYILFIIGFFSSLALHAIDLSLDTTSVTCNGSNDGIVHTIVTNDNNSPYDYYLYDLFPGGNPIDSIKSTPSKDTAFHNLSGDKYTVLVSNSNDDIAARSIQLREPDPLSIDSLPCIQRLTCFYGSDAKLQANVSGGNGGNTYRWYKDTLGSWQLINQDSAVLTNVHQSNYVVAVEDKNGCTDSSEVINFISFFPDYADSIPDAQIQQDSVSSTDACQGQNNGEIRIYFSGGTGSLEYAVVRDGSGDTTNWGSNNTISGLQPGTYRVYVRDDFGCIKKKDDGDVVIGQIPAPAADAGSDEETCEDTPFDLSGSATLPTASNYNSLSWDDGGAGGSFDDNSSLTPVYTPPAGFSGSITLTLTATGNANCDPVSDNMELTVTAEPAVDAGSDEQTCKNNDFDLSNSSTVPSASDYSSLSWDDGGAGGSFDDNTSLTPVYTPPNGFTGDITLTLTADGNGSCNQVNDNMTLTVVESPIANAGSNEETCEDSPFDLSASTTVPSASNYSSLSWDDGGAGGSFDDATSLNPVYTPPNGFTGTITLTLTANGNANCSPDTDDMDLTVTAKPSVDAGSDEQTCQDASLNLAGSSSIPTASNYSSLTWSDGGAGGSFDDETLLRPVYTPPSGFTGDIALTLTAGGNGSCDPVNDNMTLTVLEGPAANAGSDEETCRNIAVDLGNSAVVPTASNYNSLSWDDDGTGGSFDDNTNLTPVYTPPNGFSGTITLILTANGGANCNPAKDTMELTVHASPIANAGSNEETCEDTPFDLSGSATVPTASNYSSLSWSDGGAGGSFDDNTSLTPIYTPPAGVSGSITLTLTANGNASCNPTSDDMELTVTAQPTADAGSNEQTCINTGFDLTTSGTLPSASNYSSLSWSDGGAGGSFDDETTLRPVYTPPNGFTGNIALTLTAGGNGSCSPVTDNMTLNVVQGPTANAGSDEETCQDVAIDLSTSFTVPTASNYSSLYWSDGGAGGSFDDSTRLTPVYTPPAGFSGTLTLTLTVNGNANCSPATDAMDLAVTAKPSADAGSDEQTCQGVAFDLSGSGTMPTASDYGSLSWDDGGIGGSFDDNTALTPTYTPPAAYTGNITLTLTAGGNGSCAAVNDDMTLNVLAGPTANAGSDEQTCQNISFDLSSSAVVPSASNYSSLVWTDGGAGGSFSDETILTPVYNPPNGFSGNITLTLTANGNANCGPVSNDMILSVEAAPSANAGSDEETCQDASFDLSGSATVPTASNYSSLSWSDEGAGGSFDDNSTLTPVYTPPAGFTGTLALTLTANGNASCNPVTDTMELTVTPQPQADAGSDEETCKDTPFDISASATVPTASEYSSLSWNDGGTGGAFDDNTLLTPTYTPPAGFTGSIELILVANGNGTCAPVSDTMTLTVLEEPVANAGSDEETCQDASFDLSSSATNPTASNYSSLTWSDDGAGGSFTGETTLTPVYTPPAGFSGTINLILTATGNANCSPARDTMDLTVTAQPIADAGSDEQTCQNNDFDLANSASIPTASNYSGLSWSDDGAGGSFVDGATLTPVYTPPVGFTGEISLILTANGNGSCAPVNDTMNLTILEGPSANAGSDEETCQGVSFDLSASATVPTASNYSGLIWDDDGAGGSFNDNTSLTPTYTPPVGFTGNISLIITANGNANCSPVTNTMLLTVNAAPTADAGSDEATCQNVPFDLSTAATVPSASNYSALSWNDGGEGGSFDDNTAIHPVYTPPVDYTGTITLTLTADGNANCNPVSDNIQLTVNASPISEAGNDTTICYGDSVQILTADSVNASTIGWTTSGDGTFNDSSLINPYYNPGINDLNSGSVKLYLHVNGRGTCSGIEVIDSMNLVIPAQLKASVGAPNPFANNISANTRISVSFNVEGHHYIQDVSYYLVAPDGTKIKMKEQPADPNCGIDPFFGFRLPCNTAKNADITFTTEANPNDTLSVCDCSGGYNEDLSGTFAITGDWTALYGQDPANGSWGIEIVDKQNNALGPVEELTGSIIFRDTTEAGDTVSLVYESYGPRDINEAGITTYTLSRGLRVSCNGACDAEAIVQASGGTPPYDFTWSGSETINNNGDTLYLCAGNYTLTVTDALGCTDMIPVEVAEPEALIFKGISYTDSICEFSSAGEIRVDSAGGGTGNVTVSINGTDFYPVPHTFSNLGVGDHTISLSDDNNCIEDTIISIHRIDSMRFDLEVTPLTCAEDLGSILIKNIRGGSPSLFSIDDTLHFEPDDGFGGYTFQQFGNDSALFSGLPGDSTYITAIKSSIGCVTYGDTISLVKPDTLVFDSLYYDDSIKVENGDTINLLLAGDSAQIEIFAHGGAGELSYFLADTGTAIHDSLFAGDSVFNLPAGVYYSAVMDSNGCQKLGDTLLVTQPDSILIDSVITENILCHGDSSGVIQISASGGTPPLRYWLTAEDTIFRGPQSDTVFTNLPADTFTVVAADTNEFTNVNETVVIISQPDELITDDALFNITCYGAGNGRIEIEPSGGAAPYDYSVDSANSYFALNQTGRLDTTGLLPGTYPVAVRDTNGCISYGNRFIVTEPDSIAIDSVYHNMTKYQSGDTIAFACAGETTDMTIFARGGSGTLEYFLQDTSVAVQDGLFVQDSVFTVGAGVYYLVVRDTNNCERYGDTIPVVELSDSIMIHDISVNAILCHGDSSGIISVDSVTGGWGGYQYSLNGVDYQDDSLFTGLLAGKHYVYVRDSMGCLAVDSVEMNQPPELEIDTIIKEDIRLDTLGTIIIGASGGIRPFEYALDGPTDFDFGADSAYIDTLLPGKYDVFVRDANGCLDSTIVLIVGDSLNGEVNILSHALCNGSNEGSLEINIFNGTGIINYAIEGITGGTEYLHEGTTDASWQQDGLMADSYAVTVVDQENKLFTDTVEITEPSAIRFDSVVTTPASGGNGGSITIFADGGTKPYQYSVYGDTIDNYQQDSSMTGLKPGIYSLFVMDTNGCKIDTSVTIISDDILDHSIMVQQVTCFGDEDGEIAITPVNNQGEVEYRLSFDSRNIISYSENQMIFNNLAPNTYDLFMVDTAYRYFDTTIVISQPSAPVTIDSVQKQNVAGGNPGAIEVFANGGRGSLEYSVYGDVDTAYQSGTQFNGLSSGLYEVFVRDSNGCSDDTLVSILSEDTLDINITVTPALCQGSGTGTMNLEPVDNAGEVTYIFSGAIQDTVNSDTTVRLTNLYAGDYGLFARDTAGQTFDTLIRVQEPDRLNIDNLVTEDMRGDTLGSIFVGASGGTRPYQYKIYSDSAYTSDSAYADTLRPGIYEVFVMDANGCMDSVKTYISGSQQLDVKDTILSHVTCHGSNEGSILIEVYNGLGLIEYAIDGTDTRYEFESTDSTWQKDDLYADTYVITVRDDSNQSFIDTLVIGQPDPLEFDSITTIAADSVNNGSMNIFAGGGIPPYEYAIGRDSLLPFADTSGFDNLKPGRYSVMLRDSNLCTKDTLVVIRGEDTIRATISVKHVTCYADEDGAITVIPLNSSGEVEYQLQYGNTNIIAFESDTQRFEALGPDEYYLSMVDTANKFFDTTLTVDRPDDPVSIDSVVQNQISMGILDTMRVYAHGGRGDLDYRIESDTLSRSQEDAVFTGLPINIYKVFAADSNGCMDSTLVKVKTDSLLDMNVVRSNVTCAGGMNGAFEFTPLDNNGPVTYRVVGQVLPFDTTYSSTQPFVLDSLMADTYEILAWDTSMVPKMLDTTLVISEPDPINYSITKQNESNRDPGSVTIQATGGLGDLEYSLDSGTVFRDTNYFDGLAAGTYHMVIRSSLDTLCSVRDSIEILEKLDVNVATQPVACHEAGNGSVAITITDSEALLPIRYVINGDTTVSDDMSHSTDTLEGGIYQINILDSINRRFDTSVTVIEPDPVNISSFEVNDVLCHGDTTGSVSVTAIAGGWFVYEYSLDGMNYQDSSAFYGLPAGEYTLFARDSAGCAATPRDFKIQEPAKIELNITTRDAKSPDSLGVIDIASTGGTGAHQTRIHEDSAFTDSLLYEGLQPGYYDVGVLDENGCIKDTVVIIGGSDLLETQVEVLSEVLCHGDNTGRLSIQAFNAEGAINYRIEGVQTDSIYVFETDSASVTVSELFADEYRITVRDSAYKASSQTITIQQPERLRFDSILSMPVRHEDTLGSLEVFGDGGTQPYTYYLSGTDQPFEPTVNPLIEDLLPGYYGVSLIDDNGCRIDTAAIVRGIDTIDTDVDVQNILCHGDSSGIITIAPRDSGLFEYTIASMSDLYDTILDTAWVKDRLLADTYRIFVEDTNLNTFDTMVVISQPVVPVTVDSIVTTPFVSADSLGSITAFAHGGTGDLSYALQDEDRYQDDSVFADLRPGIYRVYVKDSNECAVMNTVKITGEDTLDANVAAVRPVSCRSANNGGFVIAITDSLKSDSVSYWVNGVSLYINDTTVQDTIRIDSLLMGTYEFLAVDSSGKSFEATIEVQAPETPIQIDTILVEHASNLFDQFPGALTIHASGGIAGESRLVEIYEQGELIRDTLLLNDTIIIDSLSAGSYEVYLRAGASPEYCYVTDSAEILPPLNVIITHKDITCNGDEDGEMRIAIEDSLALPLFDFKIYDNEDFYADQDTAVVEIIIKEGGQVPISITDSLSRRFDTTVFVFEPDSIGVVNTVINKPLCNKYAVGAPEGVITLDSVKGGRSPYTYEWYKYNETAQDFQLLSVDSVASKDSLSRGLYEVSIIDTMGCMHTRRYDLQPVTDASNEVFIDSVFAGENMEICPDKPITLDGYIDPLSLGRDINTIQWIRESDESIIANRPDPENEVYPLMNGYTETYTLKVSNDKCYDSSSFNVKVYEQIGIDLAAEDTVVFRGDSVKLYSNPWFNVYKWEPVEYLSDTNISNPYAKPMVDTVWYELTAYTVNECLEHDSIRILMVTNDNYEPANAFTPNGDGIHDKWELPHPEDVDEVEIYNRWGERIFYSKEYDSDKAFDGNAANGKPLPTGTYYYIIKFKYGDVKPETGTITIVR